MTDWFFETRQEAKAFAAQYYQILYWFFRDRVGGPSKDDINAIQTTMTKLIQTGIERGILSPMGDNTDISIAKEMKIEYDKSDGRLLIKLGSPWKEQIQEILSRSGGGNESGRDG